MEADITWGLGHLLTWVNSLGHRRRGPQTGLPLLPQAEQPHPATSAVPSVLAPKSQGDSLFLLPEEAVI